MELAQTLRDIFAHNENEHKARGGALFNFFAGLFTALAQLESNFFLWFDM